MRDILLLISFLLVVVGIGILRRWLRLPPPARGPICPDCGTGEMRHIQTCDWYEASTGYSDQQVLYECSACGVAFEADDLEREYLGNGRK